MPAEMTLAQARDFYLSRAFAKSRHTLDAYRRAIDLFIAFLGDRRAPGDLPVQGHGHSDPEEIPLSAFGAEDAPILLLFAGWLMHGGAGRPYKPSTVNLRLSGVMRWLQFLDDYGLLPAEFPLSKARRILRDEFPSRKAVNGPPEPPKGITEIISYYRDLEPPARLLKPGAEERLHRWELTRLRNLALVWCLAESGGRISEVLSLNVDDFPPRVLRSGDVVRVQVTGKGGHRYTLRFFEALPAIRDYIEARGSNLRAERTGVVPLFVSHAPKYDGLRMSRVVAWRVVSRAARVVGLGKVSPHDFRHWRATQLINAGHPLDVVQDYLGHRSVETTRAYYARTNPIRVDEAARSTRPGDEIE